MGKSTPIGVLFFDFWGENIRFLGNRCLKLATGVLIFGIFSSFLCVEKKPPKLCNSHKNKMNFLFERKNLNPSK